MIIHKLWLLCLIVRILLILICRYILKKKKNYLIYLNFGLLLIMGLGFTYKTITGSNNEYQIAKVFWHNVRFVHALLYLLSAGAMFYKKINLNTLFLVSDILFSLIYRLITSQ